MRSLHSAGYNCLPVHSQPEISMTTRSALFALGALFSANALAASGPFSIYFNGESQTANCHVDNVSNAQLSATGSGNLIATAATPLAFSSACGISGSAQQLTFGPAQPLQGPATTLASGSNVTGNFSVLPLNASACTVAFSPATNVAGPNAGYVCGASGSQSCASSTPISFSANFTNTGANATSWQATVNCTAATGTSPTSLASNTVTVNQNGNSGGTPVANFTCTPNGLQVSCTDASTDTGGTIGSYAWNFGDTNVSGGGTSTAKNPSYTYAASGTYTVTETVTDSVNSTTSSKTQSVTVSNNSTACTTGATGDVSGYSAICSGYMTLHTSSNTKLGPSPYTFPFVFGSNWPGSYFGYTQIFTVSGTQFISIPFTPSPAHTIGISENQTYTSFAVTFSVSTSPGLFNNGKAGNGALCVQSNNPTLQFGSAGSVTNCPNLDPNTQYWFNVIPAKYSATQGKWLQSCTGTSCQFGFYAAKLN